MYISPHPINYNIRLEPHWAHPAKEADGPYAWRSVLATQQKLDNGTVEVVMEVEAAPKSFGRDQIPSTMSKSGYLDDDESLQVTLQQLINQAESTNSIAFKLPRWGALAGRVLAHSIETLESLIRRHEPLIFKIGITHNPTWRWGNDLYGYVGAKDRWSNMLVVFAAGEPFSVAMLEASLIEKYQRISLA